jgi:hypothetical protein
MDWYVRRVMKEDGPSSLRLKAADFLRLASDARNIAISRELYQMAQRYLTLAQNIEEERERGIPPIEEVEQAAHDPAFDSDKFGPRNDA